jgi:hypothetical protein
VNDDQELLRTVTAKSCCGVAIWSSDDLASDLVTNFKACMNGIVMSLGSNLAVVSHPAGDFTPATLHCRLVVTLIRWLLVVSN